FHAVDHDDVRARLGRQLDVVVNSARSQFDEDRYFPFGGLAQLLDFEDHIVGAEKIRVTAWATLIDARREIAHASDLVGDFRAEQQPPGPSPGPLATRHLDPIALPAL